MDTGSKIMIGSGLSFYMFTTGYAAYKIQKIEKMTCDAAKNEFYDINEFCDINEFYHYMFGISVAGCAAIIGVGIGEYIKSKK
jgi:hypothetical protein